MDFSLFLPFPRKKGINIRGAWHPPLRQWLYAEQASSQVEGGQGTQRCWQKCSSQFFPWWVTSSCICATSCLSGVQIVAFLKDIWDPPPLPSLALVPYSLWFLYLGYPYMRRLWWAIGDKNRIAKPRVACQLHADSSLSLPEVHAVFCCLL